MQADKNDPVIDVTDASFAQEVVEESKTRPVVVDFWASWCAPCRTLGPTLEALATEGGGAFRLAKLDVDANPTVAGEFQVMSIPVVKAFVGGRMIDEFVGALPEPAVRDWLKSFLPTEADAMTVDAFRLEGSGDLAGAEEGYRAALGEDPRNEPAALGLGRVLAAARRHGEAREVLSPLLPDAEAERLLAGIRVDEWTTLAGQGSLMDAKRLAGQGRWREALDGMLEALPGDAETRTAILDVFEVLGESDELVKEYRPKLASALF